MRALTSANRKPHVLTIDAVHSSDAFITISCGDACPIFPGKRYLNWKLENEAGQGLDALWSIRNEIPQWNEEILMDCIRTTNM